MYWLWVVWTSGSNVAAAICCLWAFWRGGTVEKYGAAIIGVGWILTVIFKQPNMGPGAIIAGIDVVAFVLLVVLAIWSRRIWVFFAAACQLNAVFSHFANIFADYGLYSFSSANGFWGGWALLICLSAGILGYRREYKRRQTAPSGAVP